MHEYICNVQVKAVYVSNIYRGLPVKMLSMFLVVLESVIQYYHLSYPAVQQNTRTHFPPVYKSGHHGHHFISPAKGKWAHV